MQNVEPANWPGFPRPWSPPAIGELCVDTLRPPATSSPTEGGQGGGGSIKLAIVCFTHFLMDTLDFTRSYITLGGSALDDFRAVSHCQGLYSHDLTPEPQPNCTKLPSTHNVAGVSHEPPPQLTGPGKQLIS